MKRTTLVILALIFSCGFLSAQTNFSIGVNGAYLSPTGDFGNLYKSGFGGLACLTYNVTENIQLSLGTGYSRFSFNNDQYNQMLRDFYSDYGTPPTVNISSNLKIIPVMLGGKYFFTNTAFKPYAGLDLGLHIVSVDGATIKVNGQTLDAVKGESKAATAWGLAVGFLYKVAPKINLDVNAKINGDNLETGTNFSTSGSGYSSSQSSNSTVTFISVSAGLLFEL
jgi:opacity protein-like surface antigen